MKKVFETVSGEQKEMDFTLHGYGYKRKKESLYNLAIEWSNTVSELVLSCNELAEVSQFFERNGSTYGLLTEFRENAIC